MATPREVSLNDFGLLIAYGLPGFTALWGGTYFSDALRGWVGAGSSASPTLGGFLYSTIAAIAAGMTVSTIRWLVIDTIHHHTGLRPPRWDFSLLEQNVTAFSVLVDIHYRYYQFYGNALVALMGTYVARRLALGFWSARIGWIDVVVWLLVVVFFLGSRDTLRKYYLRTGQLLDAQRERSGQGVG